MTIFLLARSRKLAKISQN